MSWHARTTRHRVVLAVGLMIVGIAGISSRSGAPHSTADTVVPFSQDTVGFGRLASAVVLQASDCSGNMRMLNLLHRTPVRDRLRLTIIWYVGPSSDSLEIRSSLPSWTSDIPLRPLRGRARRDLIALGHASTPTLVVLDQDRRIRFATQSPRSPREFAGLRRIIEGLTWIEEM